MRKCVAAIIKDGDNYLMMYHKNMNAWTPPGGKVEKGESPKTAISRELYEEVGLNIPEEYLLRCSINVLHTEEYGNYILYTYLLNSHWNPIQFGLPENREFEKHNQLDWYHINDIKEFPRISQSANIIINGHLAFDDFIAVNQISNKNIIEDLVNV